MKQLVILAGGKGTRLRERLGGLPKPLIDVCGVPLLERQILLAKKYGFTEVLILVNYAAQHIVEFCASRRNWGLNVHCIDDGQPRGTAGATLAVFDRLADEFLVMYGDTMVAVDLDRFYAYHARNPQAAATLFLHPNDHPHDSDLVEIDEAGRILGFHPYPHDTARHYPNLVNAALYWVTRRALAPWRGEGGMLDFAKELFPAMLRRGAVLSGYNSSEYIKDIGTPARLDHVCADVLSGKLERASLGSRQSMVFIDRDGTINREVDHLRDAAQFELLPCSADAIRRLNASDYRCCVVSNQPVIARGECSFEGLRQIHNKMETQLGSLGAFVNRIYFCPHHPDGGYSGERAELKTDCECRKPKTGMIDRAVKEFNVARENSWMIGDTTVDMETARRAGLKSILVETGYAGLDYRHWATPDFVVPDLGAAVTFILERYPRLLVYTARLAERIGQGAFVLIGGQARCGKSTFASVLRDSLHASGKRTVILSMDRWLKNLRQRSPGVLGRYDMESLQAVLDELGSKGRYPKQVVLGGYHKLRRERINSVDTVSIEAADVVLIEGVAALALRLPTTVESLRFHVCMEEDARMERVLGEYRLRGMEHAKAMEVYLGRRKDEFPVIENLAGDAVRVSIS